jgi:uncharacterized RDD family membrane protein YckC
VSEAQPTLDTLHHVETPEGVELSLRVAGLPARAIAYAADVFVRSVFYTAAAVAISVGLGAAAGGLLFMLFALGEVIYPFAFELLADGQTLGKRMVGIRVVHTDGTRIRWQASLLRNLLLFADMLPGTYLFAIASMLASPGFRRLGDHAAGTLVIYTEEKTRPAPRVGASEPAPPALPLALDEQAAVLAFGARSGAFSAARREEIAALATPLLRAGAPAAPQLEAVAAYLRGAERAR